MFNTNFTPLSYNICFICRFSDDDECLYGKILQEKNVFVHYYCLVRVLRFDKFSG